MMTIRKIKSSYSYMIKIIIFCSIVLIGIGQVVHKNTDQSLLSNDSSYIDAPEGIQIGKTIQAKGIIQIDNDFPVRTHSLILPNKAKIGLRSNTTNLNDFAGEYTIIGVIDTIQKGIPNIEIQYIKNEKYKYRVQNNIYTYVENQLIINLGNIGSTYSFGDGKYIYIVSDNIPVITIHPFICNEKNEETNCAMYRRLTINGQNERFTTEQGQTFYKITDESRILFNDNKIGYLIESNDDENIIDFSSTITMIDTPYMLHKYQKEIFNACAELEKIDTATIERDNDIIKMTIKGTNIKKGQIGCTIDIDIWNGKNIVNISVF